MDSFSHVPCSECGDSVEREAVFSHSCDPERLVERQMLLLRGEVLAFETLFRVYLTKNEGRFATWLAAREVRRTA